MDEDRLPRQVFDCSLARSVAEAVQSGGCHEEGSGGGTTFGKLPGHTNLIPWPNIRAAMAEHALDRQAWRGAIKNLALLEFKTARQVGCMTRFCARHGRSGSCCATLPSMRPGSRGVLLIQKMRKILRPEKPVEMVRSKECGGEVDLAGATWCS
eukprot:363815-Chlamydomonas_euryale.AAC.7